MRGLQETLERRQVGQVDQIVARDISQSLGMLQIGKRLAPKAFTACHCHQVPVGDQC